MVELTKSQQAFVDFIKSPAVSPPGDGYALLFNLRWQGGGQQRLEISTSVRKHYRCKCSRDCAVIKWDWIEVRGYWVNDRFAYAQIGHRGQNQLSFKTFQEKVKRVVAFP